MAIQPGVTEEQRRIIALDQAVKSSHHNDSGDDIVKKAEAFDAFLQQNKGEDAES